jgi:hypothetical protein
VISGNVSSAVDIVGSTGGPATGNYVEGNFIGTDPTGVAADGNGRAGAFAQLEAVQISGGNDNTIGGPLGQARKVISGNAAGVDIRNGGEFNLVQGNLILGGGRRRHGGAEHQLRRARRVRRQQPPPLGPGQANEPAASGNIIGLNPNNSFTGAGNVIANNGGRRRPDRRIASAQQRDADREQRQLDQPQRDLLERWPGDRPESSGSSRSSRSL